MNKIIIKTAFSITLAAFIFMPALLNATVSNGGDDAVAVQTSAPANMDTSSGVSNGDDDSSGSASNGSSNGSDDTSSSGSSSSEISNGNDDVSGGSSNNNTGGTSSGSVSNGSDDNSATGSSNSGSGTISNGSDDTTGSSDNGDNNNNNGNGSSTGGSSSGIIYSSSGGRATILPASIVYSSCPLITEYMKSGWDNNKVEVIKLQNFLRNNEKMNVVSTGIFDEQTENAVKAFQAKYLESVLGPWSATRSTGMVYITTVKKINELACKTPMVLTQEELAIINDYIKNVDNQGTDTLVAVNQDNSGSNPVLNLENTDKSTGNEAGVVRASFIKRFWDFIIGLFR